MKFLFVAPALSQRFLYYPSGRARETESGADMQLNAQIRAWHFNNPRMQSRTVVAEINTLSKSL